jgi:hypothetical protein
MEVCAGKVLRIVTPEVNYAVIPSVRNKSSPDKRFSRCSQGCSMSLASELLHNTAKRRASSGAASGVADQEPHRQWNDLNSIVYSLIDKHEPNPKVDAALRADLRLMQLSGLIDEMHPCTTRTVCREAASVMSELLRLLPRTRQ